MELKRAKMKQL